MNIQSEIKRIAKKNNAIILAHNYQPPEIQNVADMCGDSLELSLRAAKTKADIIVFCGVKFMAETASILSPDKTVLLPVASASCPMVEMITQKELKKYISSHPNMPIVTYVNSSAEIKAMSTICCTSANAVAVVNSLKSNEIIMIPDCNLAKNTEKLTKKKINSWNGYCPVHNNLKVEEVKKTKKKHPHAVFIAHPECKPEVVELADSVLSTSGMIRYCSESKAKEFIIGTEIGLLYPIKQRNKGKIFYSAANHMSCLDMKKITLKNLLNSLETFSEEIKVKRQTRVLALKAVKRMIDLST